MLPNRSPEDPATFNRPPEDGTVERVKGAVRETTEKAQAKVEEAGRTMKEKIDDSRGPAADKLHDVASTLHDKADRLPGGEKVAHLAHNAADKMEATAQYVRQHDVHDMMTDVENFVRSHPAHSLVAAAAVGFLVGRAFKSDD